MENKREFPRKPIRLPVILEKAGEQFPASTQDVTVRGISLIVDQRLNIGDSISLTIAASEILSLTKLMGQVIRCDALENNPSEFSIVIKLHEPNDVYLMDVLAFVHAKSSPTNN